MVQYFERRYVWADASRNLEMLMTGARMTVLDQVRAFISRLSPQPVCDDCIAERLGLSVRQHANHKSRELAGGGGFEREIGKCSLGGAQKLVIRKS